MIHLTMPVAELLPGDEWYTSDFVVVIEAVETRTWAAYGPKPRTRFAGRITRGWGAGPQICNWVWPPTMSVDVRRPS